MVRNKSLYKFLQTKGLFLSCFLRNINQPFFFFINPCPFPNGTREKWHCFSVCKDMFFYFFQTFFNCSFSVLICACVSSNRRFNLYIPSLSGFATASKNAFGRWIVYSIVLPDKFRPNNKKPGRRRL